MLSSVPVRPVISWFAPLNQLGSSSADGDNEGVGRQYKRCIGTHPRNEARLLCFMTNNARAHRRQMFISAAPEGTSTYTEELTEAEFREENTSVAPSLSHSPMELWDSMLARAYQTSVQHEDRYQERALSMKTAQRSATMTVGAWVCAPGTVGNMLASAMRSPWMPCTRSSSSTTPSSSSGAIRQVDE